MNKVLIVILCFSFFGVANSQQLDSIDYQHTNASILPDSTVKLILQTGNTYMNTPYKYAGTNKNGMDCSGFVCTAYKSANISLPHSSSEISKKGIYVTADNLQAGDLIFFKGRSNSTINHVAMVSKIKDGLIYIIHATTSKGVIEEVLQQSKYFNDRWLFNKRIVDFRSE
ncbi:MAG: C40 family peptidase [Chitinophagales bacterium]|nr:C40 family peptidase [Chitinophagales bacterium]